MPQDSPSRELDKFIVRLPPGLRERIAEAAKKNKRSMNGEIVRTLEIRYSDEKIPETNEEVDTLISDLRNVGPIGDHLIDILQTIYEMKNQLSGSASRREQTKTEKEDG